MADSLPFSSQDHATIQDFAPRLLLPDDVSTDNYDSGKGVRNPLVICFHGSGETCSPTWDNLATKLVTEMRCRVLLYNREPGNLLAADVAAQMWDYVRGSEDVANEITGRDEHNLDGPYILIAHSYGGAFARAFIQHEHQLLRQRRNNSPSNRVLGMVLAETGQEGGLDPALDELQIRRTIMGSRPVFVIRGNSFIGKWKALEENERVLNSSWYETEETATQRQKLEAERDMLQRVDAEDERLKRRQLGLSRKSRFIHIPECGHNVIQDRPDEVVAAVQWVWDNAEGQEEHTGLWKWALERLKRFIIWR
ncbi:Alpha/Beta hydrolase protein [Xylaria scruposa]|nr:Alpha/Beta hydrolase protein [Xylaria scruposa]